MDIKKYNAFNPLSNIAFPTSLEGFPALEHERIEDIVGYEHLTPQGDWKLVPYSSSLLVKAPIIKQEIDDAIVFALHNENDDSQYVCIILCDEFDFPLFIEMGDYLPDEGFDFKAYDLLHAQSFFQSRTNLAVRAMEVCLQLIHASTRFSDEERTKHASNIEQDFDYLNALVDKINDARLTQGAVAGDETCHIDVAISGWQLETNAMYYWNLLKGHKLSDFDLSTLNG